MSKALSWLLVGEILAASQWDHSTGLWAQESESMFSSVVSFCQPEVSCWPRVGCTLLPWALHVSQPWVSPSTTALGTVQGDTSALEPGGLRALHLCRASLPHVLGTDGALWVRMEMSAPQGTPVLPTTPILLGQGVAWREF